MVRDKKRSSKKREPNWCKRCQHMPKPECLADHPHRIGYSTPYRRGRGFEYRIMNALKKQGCLLFRRYASKGVFDICVIVPKGSPDPRPLLIQAKRSGVLPKAEEAAMLELGKTLEARILLGKRDDNNRLVFREYDNT